VAIQTAPNWHTKDSEWVQVAAEVRLLTVKPLNIRAIFR
jgi:hypothetical protein